MILPKNMRIVNLRKGAYMTKKAELLHEKHWNRLTTELSLYRNDRICFGEFLERVCDADKLFNDMILGMYHYDELTKNEFHDLYCNASQNREFVFEKADEWNDFKKGVV